MRVPSLEMLKQVCAKPWSSDIALLHAENWMKDLAVETRDLIDAGTLRTQEEVTGWLLNFSSKKSGYSVESTLLYVGTEAALSVIQVENTAFSEVPSYFLIRCLKKDIEKIKADNLIPKQAGVARIMAMRKYGGRR